MTGARTIFDKDAFSDDTNVHHMNYDSFLASTISDTIKQLFSESFYQNRTKTYLINHGELFKAIDKLAIVDKEKFVLVAFGVNLDYFVNVLKIDSLSNNSYGGIEIISFNRTRSRLLGDCIFLLEKVNLPKLISLQIREEEIQRFDLELIDEEERIYGSVIDLNLNDVLRAEVDNGNTDRNYSKSVITCLEFNKELRWKKNIKVIYLEIYSEFISSGIPNSINDVKPYKRKYSAANNA